MPNPYGFLIVVTRIGLGLSILNLAFAVTVSTTAGFIALFVSIALYWAAIEAESL
jgi:hypothetical protein